MKKAEQQSPSFFTPTKCLLLLALLGIGLAFATAYLSSQQEESTAPVAVNTSPYTDTLYTTGIIESYQSNGSNVNLYAQVSGPVTRVFVKEGQTVKNGTPLLAINDNLAKAQLDYATAHLNNLQTRLEKVEHAYQLNPDAVSQNTLDDARHAVKIAQAEQQIEQINLGKYQIRAPMDAVVLRIRTAVGDHASPAGHYDTYTKQLGPIIELSATGSVFAVRAYLDEILIHELPQQNIKASMSINGNSDATIPLKFVRIQPSIIPKINLSYEKSEKIDSRVLPILFKFDKPNDAHVYPGQLVDVYIEK